MAPPQSGKRTSKGRQKIEMKLIENESARGTTFSKRRVGIFKKATELSTLCGVQIGIIIFSLGGKPYTFGHPSIGYVLSLFCKDFSLLNLSINGNINRLAGENVKEIKELSETMMEETEIKKKRRMKIDENLRSFPYNISDEKLIGMSLVELKKMKQKMESMREKLRREINRIHELGYTENPSSENVDFRKVEMDGSDASHWLKL